MMTRRLIFCVLLLTAAISPCVQAQLFEQARSSFDQMISACVDGATGPQIGQAMADIQAALKTGEQVGECEAMLATVYGFELARHPWKALWIGPKITPLYRSALGRDPDNATVNYLAGTGFLRAPEKFRDLNEAERLLLRAKALYEQAGNEAGLAKTSRKLDELRAIQSGENRE